MQELFSEMPSNAWNAIHIYFFKHPGSCLLYLTPLQNISHSIKYGATASFWTDINIIPGSIKSSLYRVLLHYLCARNPICFSVQYTTKGCLHVDGLKMHIHIMPMEHPGKGFFLTKPVLKTMPNCHSNQCITPHFHFPKPSVTYWMSNQDEDADSLLRWWLFLSSTTQTVNEIRQLVILPIFISSHQPENGGKAVSFSHLIITFHIKMMYILMMVVFKYINSVILLWPFKMMLGIFIDLLFVA